MSEHPVEDKLNAIITAEGIKKIKFADDIQEGDNFDCVFLLDEITTKTKKRGGEYWSLVLRDRTGTVKAKAWDAAVWCGEPVPVRGTFVKVRAEAGSYRDDIDLKLVKCRPLASGEAVALEDFVPVGPHDRFDMISRLILRVDEWVVHPGLKAVCNAVLSDPYWYMLIRDAPAGRGNHHAYIGGLLEHLFSMMGVARQLSRHYEGVDADLLIAACLFHDVGKTRELVWQTSIGYSMEGNLIGHLAIGLEILKSFEQVYWGAVESCVHTLEEGYETFRREAADKWLHLRHLIASHHGNLEWEAIKVPMSREAVLFHLIDMIDSRMGAIAALRKTEQTDSDGFTGWCRIMGGAMWIPPMEAR